MADKNRGSTGEPEAERRIEAAYQTSATEIDLGCMSQLSHLRTLSVHHNQLTHLPEGIEQLTSLTALNVADNPFIEASEQGE